MECRAGALRGAFCAQVAQGGAPNYLAGCWPGIAKGRSVQQERILLGPSPCVGLCLWFIGEHALVLGSACQLAVWGKVKLAIRPSAVPVPLTGSGFFIIACGKVAATVESGTIRFCRLVSALNLA